MPQDDVVRIRGLRKRYGTREALSGLDLSIPDGSVVLLVGPNGAGKTTLLKALMDLVPRDGGAAEVFGLDPSAHGSRVRAGIGFVPERLEFPMERMTVREILAFNRRFRPHWEAEYARELADDLELRMDAPWRTLSKGESRRVQLVTALAHRPPLLLLDEPVDGLDPVARRRVLSLLSGHLAETGATAIYSTHVLADVHRLADRLVVLKEGRMRIAGATEDLRREHRRIRIRSRSPVPSPPFLVHEEGSTGDTRDWIVWRSEDDLRPWASEAGVELASSSAVSLEEIALAHLAGHGPSAAAFPSAPDMEVMTDA